MLQDFYSVSDHFTTLLSKGLNDVDFNEYRIDFSFYKKISCSFNSLISQHWASVTTTRE